MLQDIIDNYLKLFPEERAGLQLLLEQVGDQEVLHDRKNFHGHITGAGIVLSPERTELLVVKHKALDKWLQPGGHWEVSEVDPLAAAKREVQEETQVAITAPLPITDDPRVPINISTHFIPANPAKGEPEHYHHDFRYVFIATNKKFVLEDDGITAIEWIGFDDPRSGEQLHVTLTKLRHFGFTR